LLKQALPKTQYLLPDFTLQPPSHLRPPILDRQPTRHHLFFILQPSVTHRWTLPIDCDHCLLHFANPFTTPFLCALTDFVSVNAPVDQLGLPILIIHSLSRPSPRRHRPIVFINPKGIPFLPLPPLLAPRGVAFFCQRSLCV